MNIRDEAAARLARASELDSQDRERTDHLRAVADLLLDLRETITNPATGDPDWAGASHEYNLAVSEIYDAAGVPAVERERLGSTLRYHVRRARSRRLSAEEQGRYGLDPADPVDLKRERRQREAEMVRVAGAVTESPLPEVLGVIRGMLARFTPEDVRRLDPDLMRQLLDRVADELDRLRP